MYIEMASFLIVTEIQYCLWLLLVFHPGIYLLMRSTLCKPIGTGGRSVKEKICEDLDHHEK